MIIEEFGIYHTGHPDTGHPFDRYDSLLMAGMIILSYRTNGLRV